MFRYVRDFLVRERNPTIPEERVVKISSLREIESNATNNKAKWSALAVLALTLLTCAAANAQTFSVLHAFTGWEGAQPDSGVTIRGNTLYGTTPDSCVQVCGVGPGSVYWGRVPSV